MAVVHRYAAGIRRFHVRSRTALFKIDLSWAQELCIYMFVWMAKFGAAYGVRTGIHVGVDVLINRLPAALALIVRPVRPPLRRPLHRRRRHARRHASSGRSRTPTRRSPDLESPMWIVLPGDPLGSYLMCFRFLQVAWTFSRTGELPHHDVAHVEGVDE